MACPRRSRTHSRPFRHGGHRDTDDRGDRTSASGADAGHELGKALASARGLLLDGVTSQAPGFERASKAIVVIDDSEDLAASVAKLLELEGYIACFALTGTAGLDLVFRSGAHAVVLDYVLPDMTGADVAIALRADPATRKLHIIMCTGTAEATVRESFSAYDAFLVKPVAHADLMRALDLAFTPA